MNPSDAVSHPIRTEIKETIELGLPLIGSWLIYSLSGFIGTAMVARLGHDALAASVLVSTMWMTITVFFFGIFSAISVLVSHQFGAKNYPAIGEILDQAFLLAGVSLIPISLAVLSLPFILGLTSQTPTVLALAIQYAHSLLWSAPGVILLVILEYFLNGIGRTKLSLAISLIEVPIEIALIYGFVFGKFGLPVCGIAGVGYGLAASYTATVIVLGFYLQRARFMKPFQLFQHVGAFNKMHIKELLRIGLPIGCMYLIEVTAFSVATLFMARFSTLILAAHQIVMQYLGLTINAAFAIAQTVSIRIGQNAGRKNLEGVRYATYVGLGLSFICMFTVAIFYIFFPTLLLRIDLNIHDPHNANLMRATVNFMLILAAFQLLDGMRIVASGALRGLKDTRAAMYVSFVGFWVIGLGCAYVFGFILHGRGVGVWLGLTFGIGVGAIILLLRLRYMLNKIDLAALLVDQS